jgi:lipopolysaccharide export system protein LptA
LVAQYAIAIVDSDQPVYITADNANFDNIKGIAEYEGNVVVNQGSRHLEANKLTIQRDADNQIKVMTAIGDPANFKSQPDADKPVGYGSAKIIKYYPQQNKVDLLENAKLMQNGDTLSGPKLSYNFVTEVLQGKSSKQQRTTVILQPKRAKQ